MIYEIVTSCRWQRKLHTVG